MRVRHADDVHAAVQPSVKREVCRLRIHALFSLITAGNDQKILAILFAEICNVGAECGISALMIHNFCSVDIYRRLLSCCKDLNKYTVSAKCLFWRRKCLCIPVCSAVKASVSVVTVHRIPCMRKIHACPVCRQAVRQSRIFLDKLPVFV